MDKLGINNLVVDELYLSTWYLVDFINSTQLNDHVIVIGSSADNLLGYTGVIGKYKAYNDSCRGNIVYDKYLPTFGNIKIIADQVCLSRLRNVVDGNALIERIADIDTIPHKIVNGIRCYDNLANGAIEYIVGQFIMCMNDLLELLSNKSFGMHSKMCVQYRVFNILNVLARYKLSNNINRSKLILYFNSIITTMPDYAVLQQLLHQKANCTIESLFDDLVLCGIDYYTNVYKQIAYCNKLPQSQYQELCIFFHPEHQNELFTLDGRPIKVFNHNGVDKTHEAAMLTKKEGQLRKIDDIRGLDTPVHSAYVYGKVSTTNNTLCVEVPKLYALDGVEDTGDMLLLELVADVDRIYSPIFTNVKIKHGRTGRWNSQKVQ